MGQITLVFHGRLQDFLHGHPDAGMVVFTFTQKTALKHAVEVLGVPHPEIGLIELDHQTITLEYAVQDGNTIHIHPFEPVADQYGETGPWFVLDNHLGKLADYLRLLGFDVIYARDWPDEQIADYAHEQQRILLTRDRGLLKRKIVSHGYCVRADDPGDQLAEVVALYHLDQYVTPFQRCPLCNGKLIQVAKDQIVDQLLPLTRKYYDEFTQCQNCGKIYWKGSHFEHMRDLFKPYLGNHNLKEKS
jgi:uncharacterized protein with PIN domain